jgi:hypothetical protein
VVARFAKDEDLQEALKLCQRAIEDNIDMRKEVCGLYSFFSKYGEIVDMNLDYFPDMIVITYGQHKDVLNLVQQQETPNQKEISSNLLTYKTMVTAKEWQFKVSKIDFVLPVRTCARDDDSPPNKYMPFYLQKDKVERFNNSNPSYKNGGNTQ